MDDELIKINNTIISLKEKMIDCKEKLMDAHVLYHTENKTTPVHIIKSLESKIEIYRDMISIETLKKENIRLLNKNSSNLKTKKENEKQ